MLKLFSVLELRANYNPILIEVYHSFRIALKNQNYFHIAYQKLEFSILKFIINMDKGLLELAEAPKLVKSYTLYTWWQKYVNGINLTYFHCYYKFPNCTLPRKENTFYMVTHINDVRLKLIFLQPKSKVIFVF